MTTKSVRLTITGRVQGVYYRAWTVSKAQALGLTGWVRNRRDGGVEAHATGPALLVDELVAACRQGPPAARVDQVTVSADEPCDSPFSQWPTL